MRKLLHLAAILLVAAFSAPANAFTQAPNYIMVTPPNPSTGGISITLVMMGLGYTNEFTPRTSGVVMFTISGTFQNATAGDGWQGQIVYGTGNAPTNVSTYTGTSCGGLLVAKNSTLAGATSSNLPFTLSCIASGLVLNTGYWIDLAASLVTGGSGSVNNITITAHEL